MTKMKKRLSSLLLMVLCIAMLAVPAFAYARVDTAAETSLTINYVDDEREVALANMDIQIYKVLNMTDAVRFSATDAFAGYAEMMDLVDQAKWADLATNLAALIGQDDTLAPTASGTTDENGQVKFETLTVGVYLVTGSQKSIGGYKYTPQPFMITLPLLLEDDTWAYDAEVDGKYSRSRISRPDDPNYVSRNVMKVWDDEGMEDLRPESVTVQLLCDGAVYDTVELNAENNWRKSWVRLDGDCEWTLIEVEVPENYTALVKQEGNTFVVTNTAESDEIPDDPVPGNPGKPGVDIPDEDIPLGDLPQTGILWWPVQMLTIIGILLFSAGWFVLRSGKKDGNEA